MSASKTTFSPELAAARQRYFAAMAEEQTVAEEVSGIADRLHQVNQRITSTQAEIEGLEQELKTVTEAITAGKADIDDADKIGSALDTAKRRLAGYQDLSRQIDERLQTITIEYKEYKGVTGGIRISLYRIIAKELQVEAKPILQRIAVAMRESLPDHSSIIPPFGYARRDLKELLLNGHLVENADLYATLKTDINTIYLAPDVKKAGGAKGAQLNDDAALPLS